MARRIAAHVTLVYPDEAPDLGLLVERLEAGVAAIDPFRLVLTDVGNWGDPEDGVFVHVVDADRGWAHLREWVLAPPFHALDVWPHVTLVHPRTSAAGPHAWRDLAGVRFDLEFVANAVAITGFDGRAWKTARILPLGQGEAARGRLVAAVLRRYGRVLLCRRSRDRSWYPGVWDLPGGHVEVGETAEAALVREIREELGIEVAEPSGTPLAVMEVEAAPGKGTFVLLVWVIDRWQGEITNQAPDEHHELSWVSRDELLSLRLAHPAFASLLSSAL